MKMIEVMIKLANGGIEDQTTLKIYDPCALHTYTFKGRYNAFYSNTKYSTELGNYFKINSNFLNYEVELIPPKEKKYLIKFNMRGLRNGMNYLNYNKDNEHVSIFDKSEWLPVQTKFTEKEMQSIKVVREFLEDMEGKYELIEAGLKVKE